MRPGDRWSFCIWAILCAASAPVALAGTLLVPAQYGTIQAAIDAAVDGDEVVIADGIYTGLGNKNLDFGGRAIAVRSASGDPERCLINCQHAGRAFYFHSAETAEAIIEGLMIVAGHHEYGAGVYCENASPTLINCVITGGAADVDGGGLYCLNATPTLTGCLIKGNSCSYRGGGVYFENASPTLTDCTIQGNAAHRHGGGLYCDAASSAMLTGCAVLSNETGRNGGGLYFSASDATLTNCTIGSNDGSSGGGAACYESCNVVCEGCTFETNTASSGGALYGDNSSVALSNCSVDGNSATGDGGALLLTASSDLILTECEITRNRSGFGGGLYCSGSSLMVSGCTFGGNAAGTYGGGAYIDNSSGELTACTSTANTANTGGAWYLRNSAIPITDCSFVENTAIDGGALMCYSSDATLSRCNFCFNTARQGGGLDCWESSPALTDCTVSRNRASYGGGIYCSSSNAVLVNTSINANTACWSGGGLNCSESNPTLINCAMLANVATQSSGGGVYGSSSSPSFINCTIAANRAREHGGGTSWGSGCSPVFTNCILWNNEPEQIYCSGATATVTYCDVRGGWTGTGNISTDPRFAFADDVHLSPTSPCIDRGTDAPPGGLPGSDLDGNPRPLDGNGDGQSVADMGAYEFNPVAPCIAATPSEIRFLVAPGESQSQTLQVRNSGPGTLAWQLECDADWLTASPAAGESAGETDTLTLSVQSDSLAPGTYAATLWVTAAGACRPRLPIYVVLHIARRVMVPSEQPSIQAALLAAADGDEVLLENGIYTGGRSKDLKFYGKAVTLRSESGNPAACIIDCQGDRPAFIFDSAEGPSSIVEGLTIQNGSYSSGGAIYCSYAAPSIINCYLINNAASGEGGAVYSYNASPRLINCLIARNTAVTSGGAVYYTGNGRDCPTLINCTLTANSAGQHGGGVASRNGARPTIVNCIIWGNGLEQIYTSSSYPAVTYSDVQGGWTGAGNIDLDPLFTDAAGDDYRLAPGSPCIDAGSNSAVPADSLDLDGDGDTTEPAPFDLLGQWRFIDDPSATDTGSGAPPLVDMGAFEYQVDADPGQLIDFAECMRGPDTAIAPDCDSSDFQADADVDLTDFAILQSSGIAR